MDLGPGPSQGGQGHRCRVAVVVVPTAGDESDPGCQPIEQRRVLVRRPVVRDLEHVHLRQVRTGGQQPPLSDRFEVAGQEDGQPRRPQQQGDARVVGAQPPGAGGRPQHLPAQPSADAAVFPLGRGQQRYTRGSGRPLYEAGLRRTVRDGGDLHGADRSAPEDAGQTAHVVGVEVAEDEQRYTVDPQPAQAAVHGPWIGPGVDDEGRAGARRDHQAVPLPDVAHDEPPARGRPPGDGPGDRRRAHQRHDQEQGEAGGRPGTPECPAGQCERREGRGRQERGAEPAVGPAQLGPRERGTRAGDQGDPPGGPGGAPQQRLGE